MLQELGKLDLLLAPQNAIQIVKESSKETTAMEASLGTDPKVRLLAQV